MYKQWAECLCAGFMMLDQVQFYNKLRGVKGFHCTVDLGCHSVVLFEINLLHLDFVFRYTRCRHFVVVSVRWSLDIRWNALLY